MANVRFTQLPNVARTPGGQPGLQDWTGFYPPTAWFTLSKDGTKVVITDNPGVNSGGGYIYSPVPLSLEFDPTIPQGRAVEIHQYVQQREIQIDVPDAYQRD